jgi:adenylate cyclase
MKKRLAPVFVQYRPVFLSSLTVTAGVLGLRLLGLLQPYELQAFDRLIQLRPSESRDERIILVGITDADLKTMGRAEISDQAMATLIRKISTYRPRLIGLDLYRNLPFEPGHQELQAVLRSTPNLIGIQKVNGDESNDPIPGNAALAQADRLAASDVLADADGRVRRALLFPNTEITPSPPGLGFRLAIDYLAQLGIRPDSNPMTLRIAGVSFPAFAADDGGYARANDRGYQLLLNLRASPQSFRRVSMRQVIDGTLPPDLMKDRIVLIGAMLPGNSDSFFTAYSSAFSPNAKPMYGVELHAHVASQIISAVLDKRPLIYVFPDWVEVALMYLFANLGALIYLKGAADLPKAGLTFSAVGGVVVGSYLLGIYGWWFPAVPTAMAIVGAAAAMSIFNAQQLKALSTQDELTKLANRRTFNEHLEKEWFRAMRSHTSLSLILCDVDYFKLYNDTYGHPQGDECLRQVAAALKQCALRSDDVVARYGGEEFVILLPNTDVQGALNIAELARTHIEALDIRHQSSKVSEHLTLSLGVSTVLPSVDTLPGSLVKTADLALYEAKQKGRNQAILKTL